MKKRFLSIALALSLAVQTFCIGDTTTVKAENISLSQTEQYEADAETQIEASYDFSVEPLTAVSSNHIKCINVANQAIGSSIKN